jgi:hypothetical protein
VDKLEIIHKPQGGLFEIKELDPQKAEPKIVVVNGVVAGRSRRVRTSSTSIRIRMVLVPGFFHKKDDLVVGLLLEIRKGLEFFLKILEGSLDQSRGFLDRQAADAMYFFLNVLPINKGHLQELLRQQFVDVFRIGGGFGGRRWQIDVVFRIVFVFVFVFGLGFGTVIDRGIVRGKAVRGGIAVAIAVARTAVVGFVVRAVSPVTVGIAHLKKGQLLLLLWLSLLWLSLLLWRDLCVLCSLRLRLRLRFRLRPTFARSRLRSRVGGIIGIDTIDTIAAVVVVTISISISIVVAIIIAIIVVALLFIGA